MFWFSPIFGTFLDRREIFSADILSIDCQLFVVLKFGVSGEIKPEA
jgi:hypothetical protein